MSLSQRDYYEKDYPFSCIHFAKLMLDNCSKLYSWAIIAVVEIKVYELAKMEH